MFDRLGPFAVFRRMLSILPYSHHIAGHTGIKPFMTGTQVRFVELDWAKEEYKSSIGHQQRKSRKVGKDSSNGVGFSSAPSLSYDFSATSSLTL